MNDATKNNKNKSVLEKKDISEVNKIKEHFEMKDVIYKNINIDIIKAINIIKEEKPIKMIRYSQIMNFFYL